LKNVTLSVQQVGQCMLALLDWLLAQVFAVKLDQVEGAEHSGAVLPVARQVKDRRPIVAFMMRGKRSAKL
jgi:hypothetical protein